MNIKWGQMYEFFIFSKYISHKKEIKVNNLTLDYGQNLVYPLIVLKFDPKLPILFKKSQNLPKISSKMHFQLHIILFALDNIQNLGIVLILYSRIAYILNSLGFSSILIFGGGVIQCLLTCP